MNQNLGWAGDTYLRGEYDKGNPFAFPINLLWYSDLLNVPMFGKHLTQILLGGAPIDVGNVDLPSLVKRTRTMLFNLRIRNLCNELQLTIDWLTILLRGSFCLSGGLELHVAEPTMGVVFEGRESNIDNIAVLNHRQHYFK